MRLLITQLASPYNTMISLALRLLFAGGAQGIWSGNETIMVRVAFVHVYMM